jgi:hypothetical protein
MNEYPLSFVVNVQTDLDYDDFVTQLAQEWDFERILYGAFETGEKFIEVRKNPLHDPDLVSDPTDGFLYYRFNVIVGSKGREHTASEDSPVLVQWIEFAKSLKLSLDKMRHQAVIVADFERFLDE